MASLRSFLLRIFLKIWPRRSPRLPRIFSIYLPKHRSRQTISRPEPFALCRRTHRLFSRQRDRAFYRWIRTQPSPRSRCGCGSTAETRQRPPWPKPYLRGLDDMVFAGFDARSSLLADLAARNVIGRFSAAMARDTKYWRSTIFPMLLSIIAGSVGIVELHASCVATEEQGLIFIGPSRSGKSTIAMALVNAGFRLLSDDRVFCSLHDGKPLAYGLPRPLKLRRDAGAWFEEWKDREPTDVQNGENVFFWNSDRAEGQGAPRPCIPQALIFLERGYNAASA